VKSGGHRAVRIGCDPFRHDLARGGLGRRFLGGNTTLGRIGVGYIYADWIPQISYTSPKSGGFQYSAGLFQGMDIVRPQVWLRLPTALR